jgi:threonine synthase
MAGLRKLANSGIIKRDELTVAFITGAGLKTQEVIAKMVHPLVIEPTLESFEEVFGK